MSRVAPTMQLFFTERLAKQRQASPATVISYQNTFRLLLRFLQDRTGKAPSVRDWDDLGAEVICAFLDHLEADRHNSPRSRNARLAALRSLFRYAALRHPEHAQLIQQVLAIPQKRYDKATVTFLEPGEVDALLAAPNLARWEGRRDRALIALAVQTGLRTSGAPAKAESSAASRSPPPPRPSCGPGCGSGAVSATIPCSPPAPAAASATTRSKRASPSTRPPPASAARPSQPKSSPRTHSGTPLP